MTTEYLSQEFYDVLDFEFESLKIMIPFAAELHIILPENLYGFVQSCDLKLLDVVIEEPGEVCELGVLVLGTLEQRQTEGPHRFVEVVAVST